MEPSLKSRIFYQESTTDTCYYLFNRKLWSRSTSAPKPSIMVEGQRRLSALPSRVSGLSRSNSNTPNAFSAKKRLLMDPQVCLVARCCVDVYCPD